MKIVRHLRDGVARLAILNGDTLADLDLTDASLADASLADAGRTDLGTGSRDLPALLKQAAPPPETGRPPEAGSPAGPGSPAGAGPLANTLAHIASLATGAQTPFDKATVLSPVGAPPAIYAVGLNYAAHAAEGGRAAPTVPVIFTKHHNCITNPAAPIHIPAAAPDAVDYEGELAMVIGRRCRHVPAESAPLVIAGYTIMNDVSVRDWQRASPTMMMGKSWDTHGPCGPVLVTGDEIDPHSLQLTTTVNGEVRQDANTDDLIFNCYQLVEHLTTAFTLEPGTIITTGTPAGVGLFFDPPKLLSPGDEVSITIDGIGTLTNPVIAEPDTALI